MFIALLATICTIAFLLAIIEPLIGRNGSVLIVLFFNFMFVSIGLWNLYMHPYCILWFYGNWFNLLNSFFGFFLNWTSFLFIVLIFIITTCVILFSISYMYNDIRITYFLSLIQFFMFFMLILVSSSNILFMFIGWEGVGIISFLLINFWFYRMDSNKGALKAIVFNRIGDAGYFVFVSFLIASTKSVDFIQLSLSTQASNYFLFFLILAICGKSAQLVLYAWLPDAMEGPTPVSSLLHSATMVTAGVFLFVRTFELFTNNQYSSFFLMLMTLIGLFTGVLSGLFAVKKYDLKKIIAFSTCSQLGLLVAGIGLGLLNESFFYLYVHAFFKCLLFVTSGVIIHILLEEQDMRKMMTSFYNVPVFYICMLCGSASMAGLFFFSGYYAKEVLLVGSSLGNIYVKSAIYIISFCTLIYSVRLIFLGFGNSNQTQLSLFFFKNVNKIEIDFFHLASLTILFIGSVILGFYIGDGILNYEIWFRWFNSLSFELTSSSLLFTMSLLLIYICFCYKYIYKTTKNLSLFSHKFIFLIHKFIMIECFFPFLYWFVSKMLSFIIYKYILLCYDRLVLDSISVFSWFTLIKDFYNKFNSNYLELDVILKAIFYLTAFCLVACLTLELLYCLLFLFFLVIEIKYTNQWSN